MKRFGKALAFLLVLVMVVSITACDSSQDNEPTTNQDNQSSNENNESTKLGTIDGKDPETGLPMLADRNNPVTFEVFIRDPGQAPAKDNPVIKKITELTGVTIDFEFLVGDLAQKQGVMIAGGDYPDAIFAESQKFIDAGAYIPLEDKLPNYPNLNDLYSPVKKYMTAKDGHIYVLELYMQSAPQNPPPIFDNGGAGFF
ncbi:MAG: putative aldouronate transport system substrate-binding protein, partial [Clostridiales bacterium]|nr:putative aldouronate transport system substrate-binding protein [Clostridiales bacterium]